jgi:hypothetical protein
MAFEKGISGNPDGRPKGSRNKVQGELQEKIGDFLLKNMETLQKEYNKLPPTEKVKFFSMLAAYILPKYKQTESTADNNQSSYNRSGVFALINEHYREIPIKTNQSSDINEDAEE